MRKIIEAEELADGILAGKRIVLGQAITLIESQKREDQELAGRLIEKIFPHTGNSIRVGITGPPGVGKSTFIESLGIHIIEAGNTLAVLAIDPSSLKSKGSILGDKTRMETLSKNAQAFIRPTAAGDILGGVANHTRETILLCEAAGFNVIIVETVGVGQSEVTVRSMVDFFLLLMLAGAGDELQAIKKGIMEMADGIAITKADGDNIGRATQAKNDYQNALHLFEPAPSGWTPQVVTCSALAKIGLIEVWKMIDAYKNRASRNGYLTSSRLQQDIEWFHSGLNRVIKNEVINHFISTNEISSIERQIRDKLISPKQATQILANKIKDKFNL